MASLLSLPVRRPSPNFHYQCKPVATHLCCKCAASLEISLVSVWLGTPSAGLPPKEEPLLSRPKGVGQVMFAQWWWDFRSSAVISGGLALPRGEHEAKFLLVPGASPETQSSPRWLAALEKHICRSQPKAIPREELIEGLIGPVPKPPPLLGLHPMFPSPEKTGRASYISSPFFSA